MNIIGLIPARSGSKRVPGKNIKMCAGKPLILWTIEAALSSKLNEIYVSSDSPEILSLCNNYSRVKSLIRPDEFASDEVPMMPVISHFIENMKSKDHVDAIMLLQPTSPLRNHKHINESIDLFNSKNADSLVSVVEAPHAFHPNKVMTINDSKLTPYLETSYPVDDEWPIAVGRNGPAILLSTVDVLRQGNLYGNKIIPYVMGKSVSIDVDDPYDFKLAEWLLTKS